MKNNKSTNWGKILLIICGIIVGVVVLVIAIITIVSATSKKLDCVSNQGHVTIMYNDNTIVGYTATDMAYDLDQQKLYAEQIGIEDYINEFTNWFSTHTDGVCTRK